MQQKSKIQSKDSNGLRRTANGTTSPSSFYRKPRSGPKLNSVDATEAIEEAIYYAGRLNFLAESIGISKAAIHRAKTGEKVSGETAQRVLFFLEKHLADFKNRERVLRRIVDDLREKL